MDPADVQSLVGKRFRTLAFRHPSSVLPEGVWRITFVSDAAWPRPILAVHEASGFEAAFDLLAAVYMVEAYDLAAGVAEPSPALAARLRESLTRQAAVHGVAMTADQAAAIAANIAYAVPEPERCDVCGGGAGGAHASWCPEDPARAEVG